MGNAEFSDGKTGRVDGTNAPQGEKPISVHTESGIILPTDAGRIILGEVGAGSYSEFFDRLHSTRLEIARNDTLWAEIPPYEGPIDDELLSHTRGLLQSVRSTASQLRGLDDIVHWGYATELEVRTIKNAHSEESINIFGGAHAAQSDQREPLEAELQSDLQIVLGLDPHVLGAAFSEGVLNEEESERVQKAKAAYDHARSICASLAGVESADDPRIGELYQHVYQSGGNEYVGLLTPLTESGKSVKGVERVLFPFLTLSSKNSMKEPLIRKKREIALITLYGPRQVQS